MIKNLTRLSILVFLGLLASSVAAYALQGPGSGEGFGFGGFGGGFPRPPFQRAQDPGLQQTARVNVNGTPMGSTLIPANDQTGEAAFFANGLTRFQAVEMVSNAANNGLGPRFNSNSCSSCHAFPVVGGSSAPMNPQFVFAGGPVAPHDTRPAFITPTGATREARFPFFFNQNGTPNLNSPNGGVEDLFTVTGRGDAGACTLQQPNFQQALATNNVIFRIPTPTYGSGLIENLDDSTLLANRLVNLNNTFGISGTFNHIGNDSTISRYGWKAQNKSLWIFAAEAYNVEEGITNLGFPNERPTPEEDGNGGMNGVGLPANCLNLGQSGYPEDTHNPLENTNAAVLDDVSAFANFMRFLAPPPRGPVVMNGTPVSQATIANGEAVFAAIGCATCHNPALGPTQPSNLTPGLSTQMVNLFSDMEIHHMGAFLADNVSQGNAGGDQFRTAPLWGTGQRAFFLHDGRTSNLVFAIESHASNGSEATATVQNFNNLNPAQQQALLDFLRSL